MLFVCVCETGRSVLPCKKKKKKKKIYFIFSAFFKSGNLFSEVIRNVPHSDMFFVYIVYR